MLIINDLIAWKQKCTLKSNFYTWLSFNTGPIFINFCISFRENRKNILENEISTIELFSCYCTQKFINYATFAKERRKKYVYRLCSSWEISFWKLEYHLHFKKLKTSFFLIVKKIIKKLPLYMKLFFPGSTYYFFRSHWQ